MDCPRCQGFLQVEEYGFAVPPDVRCLNCGWRPVLVRISAPDPPEPPPPAPPSRAQLNRAALARYSAGLCRWCDNLRLPYRKICKRHQTLLAAAQHRRRAAEMTA